MIILATVVTTAAITAVVNAKYFGGDGKIFDGGGIVGENGLWDGKAFGDNKIFDNKNFGNNELFDGGGIVGDNGLLDGKVFSDHGIFDGGGVVGNNGLLDGKFFSGNGKIFDGDGRIFKVSPRPMPCHGVSEPASVMVGLSALGLFAAARRRQQYV